MIVISLDIIHNGDGQHFSTSKEWNDYIVNFFHEIYKKPACEPENLSGCIQDFLGEDICRHPVVKNCILTTAERDKLEAPLSLRELDEAVSQANKKSAPGMDGLSIEFITRFWPAFRVPLFRYANCCFDKGELTPTFRSASIRLIPKKGDITQLKNWRPISLLSNLYKILSRALNNRLKTITDCVTSRAQKGFTSSRYLQEVLINVIEFIGHCNKNDIGAFILSIDFAKAFDTISVNFMSECYRFFGLGPSFTNMLETVGKKR